MKGNYMRYVGAIMFLCLVARVTSSSRSPKLQPTTQTASPVCLDKDGSPIDFNERYAIVIDGGSQGTRAHVYKLRYCENQIHQVISDAMCRNFFPLSNLTNNLPMVRSSIQMLLDFAERNVPKSRHAATPIALMATAGLRLTGPIASERILQAVRNTLASSPFQFLNPEKYVSVISGADEGIWSWIATNFLAERIGYKAHQVKEQTGKSINTTAILDLGGASFQIAYELTEDDRKAASMLSYESAAASTPGPITTLDFGGAQYHIYQTSFLGFGLIEARKKTLRWFVDRHPTSDVPAFPCLPPGTRNPISRADGSMAMLYGGPDIDSAHCSDSIAPIFPLNQVKEDGTYWYTFKDLPCAKTLQNMDIHVQSFFADILQPFFNDSTNIQLAGIEKAAKTACSVDYFADPTDNEQENLVMRRKKLSHIYGYARQNEFMCQDMAYILQLLRTGLGLTSNSKLTALKFMHDVELGWALGAAMQMIDERN